jgi:hypothetical protein
VKIKVRSIILKKTAKFLLFILILSCIFSFPSEAGEIRNVNQADKDESIENVEKINLAFNLLSYGRKNKSPAALLTAAEIIGTTPVRLITDTPAIYEQDNILETEAPGFDYAEDPLAIIEEAVRMSENDPVLVAFAEALTTRIAEYQMLSKVSKGPFRGAFIKYGTIKPGHWHKYEQIFKKGRTAIVTVIGNGDTPLALYVFDENKNKITADLGPGDQCRVEWMPESNGAYSISIKNQGAVENRYRLVTN